MKHLGDITKIHGDQIEPVDCITGGSPCQDLSVAGPRNGLTGERSGLFVQQIRIVKEMRARDRADGRTGWAVRPRFMVWENVPGTFSSNGGKDFQAVLTEIVKIAEPDAPDVPLPDKGRWSKAGCLYSDMGVWSIAWRVHDAQFWGVPQRRKRISLVADFGGLSAPEILFERKSLSWDSTPCGTGTERKHDAGGTFDGVKRAIGIHLTQSPVTSEEKTPCLSSGNPKNGQATVGVLQIGCDVYNFRCSGEVANTLTAAAGGTNTSGTKVLISNEGDIAGTIDASYYRGCGARNGKERTIVCAVDCRNMKTNPDINGTLQAKSSVGSSVNYQNVVRIANRVRRLTPLECERLQGFPDGWTDIGKWTDSKGKKRKDADGPRYKALGNSIALPYWFWLIRRISAQFERPATLGSLFDGIGGFPLCWERCNGKGTARWASEIEEFPIAVTKIHFPEEDT